jgi:hypothetical protein
MSTCQACQRVCATSRVTLMQNIGFVIARQSKNLTAELCRECGLKMANEMTLITFFFGWWGVISFILTPIILITNVVAMSKLRSLPAPDAPWSPPGVGPNVTQDFAGAQQMPQMGAYVAPRPQQTRAEKTGHQSALVSIFGLVFFCVPLVSAAGLYMSFKAKRQAEEDGTAFPKSAVLGMTLSSLGLLAFLGSAVIGYMGWRETEARLVVLHEKADKGRTLAALEADEACALVEERLVEDNYEGKSVKTVSCKGALSAREERAELDGITADFEGGSTSLTACLRKGDRWFVAALEPCSEQALGPKQAGLTPEAQEATWRAAEKKVLETERVSRLKEKLRAIGEAVDKSGEELKDCSRDTAIGRTIPHHVAELGGDAPYRYVSSNDATIATVDRGVLTGQKPGDWEFLNSRAVRGTFNGEGYQAKQLQAMRYVLVMDSAVARELPTVPSSSPNARYDGGAFIGMMYLADLQAGQVLCASPFVFENSETISVSTYRGSRASDETVRSEALKDFMQQYVSAVEKTLDKVLREAPEVAEADPDAEADAPAKKAPAAKPPPPAAKKPAKKNH